MNIFLNNFRSFENQNLKFSRINILIGENSGGKSSLLKFLLSLKQTIDSPLESNLKLRGDFTDLGNYQEVIRNNEKTKAINFGFSDESKYISYFVNLINKIEKEEDSKENKIIIDILSKIEHQQDETKIRFTINQNLNNHKNIRTTISNSSIGRLAIINKKVNSYDNERELTSDIIFKYDDQVIELKENVTFKEGFFTLFDFDIKKKIFENKNIKNHYEIYYRIIFLLIFQNYCHEFIDSIRFVNPIGNSPKRLYFQEDKKSNYKLIDIEKFINILGDSSISKREFEYKMELLNEVIQKSGIAEEIEINKNEELSVLTLNVKTKGFWANITDVGYGVSLQLPILFQAILSEHFSKKQETLLIEQPEVHLHPSLQSRFIETLLSIGNKNQYFIETHSEHIIRKLQVLVKTKGYNIKPEDITIHYFRKSDNKFEISSHPIDEFGKLSPNFPTGFYDNTYKLVKELF